MIAVKAWFLATDKLMTSINGFCNKEFELGKELSEVKMHVSVIKMHDRENGCYITENTVKTKFETFW